MNNLIVDIGNTRVKVAVLCGDDVVAISSFCDFGDDAKECVGGYVEQYGITRAIVSSTRGSAEVIADYLRGFVEYVLLFDASTRVPIESSYSTPETLGRDRLAAAVAASGLYGDESDAQVVVDLGSALTIDVVTRRGGFEGGTISPGIAMRFRSLHEFTQSLPLCSSTMEELDVARTTRQAIEQGVMEGVKYEIEGQIEKIRCREEKISVIFVGGDAKILVNRIKNTIFAECELVLVGLNRILNYNAQ